MIPPPPKFVPRSNLIQGFAAPTFDPRFHTQDKLREHTVTGLLLEAWARGKIHPEEENPYTIEILNLIDQYIRSEYPAVVQEIEAFNG